PRVPPAGIAHARRSLRPLQPAQADWTYHGVRPLQYRGYRNPRVDVRRVQPGPEGDPPHGSPHGEVRVPLGTRDWLQVVSAVEPVYLPQPRRLSGEQAERLPARDGQSAPSRVGRPVRRLPPGRLARQRSISLQPRSALRLLSRVWLQVPGCERPGGDQQSEQSDRHPPDGFRRATPAGQAY